MNFKKVGIVGAGTMGAGIATSLAQHGVSVVIVDQNDTITDRAIEGARKFYARAAEKGRMTETDAEEALGRLSAATEVTAVSGCDLVIEAVFEEAGVKAEVYGRLNPVIGDTTVVATNTSCLRVSDLAEAIDHPSRFLGLHYFNPAAISPIVEVVRGEGTDPAVFDRAIAFCRETGKKPLACADSFGFALNRFFVPYSNEAIRLMDEGIGTPAQIDRVARDCLGVAAGPFLVTNLVKPRIMYHAQSHLGPHGPFYAMAGTLKEKGDTDYEFEIGEDSGGDPNADGTIADRLRAAAFFPVLQELDEQVASPEDIDMGASLALRFGKPPCQLMDELGKDEVARLVSLVTEKYGQATPSSLEKVGNLRH